MREGKITVDVIRGMKGRQRLATLTAYDYPMARLLDEAGIPLLLVGDSLGMVVLGYPDTTHVTMEEIEHHVRAVARAHPKALIIGDMPYHSYETPELAVAELQEIHLERLELQILVVVEVDHILLHMLVALVVLVW